ncbi:MAG TPA: asparagine synthase-related protein [Candidatus Hydrogenedentes bacterium]|nr:asparagine synthase-related protein [Candidatus Hydrogenedentota bacterium]
MPPEKAETELHRMVQALNHESFYTTGTWSDPSLGIYVGWIARKNSFSDAMPIKNERGDVVLFFSGEEFSPPEVRRNLTQKGHSLGSNDPSYLVHLYEEESSFPSGLNGIFHGLLVDKATQTALLFNDRFGMHRIYYHESREAFYFAAEAKAILRVRQDLRSLNPRSLGEFVACGCVLENRTLFHNICLLPPGSAWIIRSFSIERRGCYFEPKQWENQSLLDPESYYRQFRAVFSKNLPRYFNGRERVALSLTGGLDTRMIIAAHNPSLGSLPCYTFGGMFRDSQDVRVARKVAAVCGQTHEVLRVGSDFLSRFSQYAERTVYLTDGNIDVSFSPDLFLNENARKIAPVRMTGNYGGEVLRHLRPFKPTESLPGLFTVEIFSAARQAKETYDELLQEHPLSFIVFRQCPWFHYGLLALEQTQLSLRTPYLDNDLVQTAFRAPESAITNNEACLRLIRDSKPQLCQIWADRGPFTERSQRFYERASRTFLNFTFKAEYAYDYGMPQWLARIDGWLSPIRLDRLFLGRHKFKHFRLWYRGALAPYVREMLLDSQTVARPYLERSTLEGLVRDHLAGVGNYTREIHKILTLEIIARKFLD